MTQEFFFNPEIKNKYESFDKLGLLQCIDKFEFSESTHNREIKGLQIKIGKLETLIQQMLEQDLDLKESLQEQIEQLQATQFGKSSEKSTPEEKKASGIKSGDSNPGDKPKLPRQKRKLLPSERYPDAEITNIDITLDNLPVCPCCATTMSDSGMTEDSERLTVIPKKYVISRYKRHKYRCKKCQGAITTAPAVPTITPGGAFSDELAIDVSVSKFCDLVPMNRYAKIAERAGIKGLAAQSLIDATHSVALFIRKAYRMLKEEILLSKILHADETPHRMLEGDEKENWYLWGFSNEIAAYFEIKDTRSGDVASGLLKQSVCEYLMSDVFSGYAKAVRETNEYRETQNKPKMANIYCNSHARRYFKKIEGRFKDEAKFFLDKYRWIYFYETLVRDLKKGIVNKPPDWPDTEPYDILELRRHMRPMFEAMKIRVLEKMHEYSTKSGIFKAMNYFLKNYNELTAFIETADLPIDNNPQERLLRNPVIGRKTWFGTHSKQGAETTAVLFSIMESCKLNKVNPRAYLGSLIAALHLGQPAFTPHTYATTPALRQYG